MRMGKKRGDSVHLWSTMHPHYYVSQQSIVGGGTCRHILQTLPTDDADIAKEDCTLVFCMLNVVSGDRITTCSETSSAGQDMIDLCGDFEGSAVGRPSRNDWAQGADYAHNSAAEAKATSAWLYGGGPHRHDGYDTAAT